MLKEKSGYWLLNNILYIIGSNNFSYDDFQANRPAVAFFAYCFKKNRYSRVVGSIPYMLWRKVLAEGEQISCFLPRKD